MPYTLALLGANVAVVLRGAHWVRDGLLRSRPVATTLLALWWRHRGRSPWRAHATTVGVVAGLILACMVPFTVVLLARSEPGMLSDSALGLVERCVVVLDVVAIVALARWSRAMSKATGSGHLAGAAPDLGSPG